MAVCTEYVVLPFYFCLCVLASVCVCLCTFVRLWARLFSLSRLCHIIAIHCIRFCVYADRHETKTKKLVVYCKQRRNLWAYDGEKSEKKKQNKEAKWIISIWHEWAFNSMNISTLISGSRCSHVGQNDCKWHLLCTENAGRPRFAIGHFACGWWTWF